MLSSAEKADFSLVRNTCRKRQHECAKVDANRRGKKNMLNSSLDKHQGTFFLHAGIHTYRSGEWGGAPAI